MTKARRILALVIAAIMIVTAACPTAFARRGDDPNHGRYTDAATYPYQVGHLDGVNKYKFNAEQGATYVLDLLDDLLRTANLQFKDEKVVDEWYAAVTLKTLDFSNIDAALWTLYNVVWSVNEDSDLLENWVNIKVIGIPVSDTVIGWIVGALDLGDIESLNVSCFGNQNANSRVCRNVPAKTGVSASSDIAVLKLVTQFLSDNRIILKKLATNELGFGTLDSTIKGIDGVGPILDNFIGFLKDTLYGALWDSQASAAPSGWTYDRGAQDIVDWLLIKGTGKTTEYNADLSKYNGCYSALGAEAEALLPAMADQPGAASLTGVSIQADRNGDGVKENVTMNFYQLISNAIQALLSGMVSDLLLDVLIDALDIDTSEDPRGDTVIMADALFNTIVGAIETLCTANGAPEIIYEGDENDYPVPKLTKLLDWFFAGGGLATFIKIDYNGIQLTDNFMSLLNDLIRILPGLFPLLGFEVPEGLTYTTSEMTEKFIDSEGTKIYLSYEKDSSGNRYELYKPDPDNNPDTYYYYAGPNRTGTLANTTNPSGSGYLNATFIREKYVLSDSQIYAALVKILLNSFVDGCYFPDWADSIASVGAYALASIAARYIPENNYFDRLDKYHYEVELGQTYTPLGTSSSITALPYTESLTLNSHTVTVPRAAMNIGISLLAYYLRGWEDMQTVFGYDPAYTDKPWVMETDTSFEVWALEFLMWGASQFVPMITGKIDVETHQYVQVESGVESVFRSTFNTAMSQLVSKKRTYPTTYNNQCAISNVPGGQLASTLGTLIDNTLFKLIPLNWLPQWVAQNGSQGVFYELILESVCNFDLQKIFSLLTINPSGEFATAPITVIIRIIDRVLGLVFGGNPLLPSTSRTNVFDTNTTVTSLESLLANGTNLGTLVERLLELLNKYIGVIGATVFPLILSGTVKSSTYAPAGEGYNERSYLNGDVSYQQLRDYIDEVSADGAATVWSGDVYYTSTIKATTVATDIGIKGYDAESNKVANIGGVSRYKVSFPATYIDDVSARRAATYIKEGVDASGNKYTGNYEQRGKTVNGERIQEVYLVDDYRTGSSDEHDNPTMVDGVVTEHHYTYDDFDVATAVVRNGSYRTGAKGEVTYTDGYRCFGEEDFRATELYAYNRWNDAIEDADSALSSFTSYTESTLPAAYGDWLMYFVRCQLNAAGHYDKNNDGVIDHRDATVNLPSSDYPYYKTSGSTSEFSYSYDAYNPLTTGTNTRAWSFSACSSSNVVIAAALAYSAEADPVVLSDGDAQDVIRYALNNHTFKISQFSSLSTSQLNTIETKCNSLGLTLDRTNLKITRDAFKLIPATLDGKTTFGAWKRYTGNDTDGYTLASTVTLDLAPIASTVLSPEYADKDKNDIQEAYINFAKNVYNNTMALNDYYDNISWRTEIAYLNRNTNTLTNTLDFMLAYTRGEYYPGGENNGVNKLINDFGIKVSKYTASSFDEFQKAWDYGYALSQYIKANNFIPQSLVTKAYKGILAAFKALKLYGEAADWTELENFIEMAQSIINGPLGVGSNVNRDYGYTLSSLSALQTALTNAQTYKSTYFAAYDAEYQQEIDDEATLLESAIKELAFTEGLEKQLVLNPNFEGTSDVNPSIVDDSEYTDEYGVVSYKIITGISEGESFDNMFVNGDSDEKVIIASGFQEIGSNSVGYSESGFGKGTGSHVDGIINYIPVITYWIVIYGDLNGDTRIDGTDKTIINTYIAQQNIDEQERYIQIAADVNADGAVSQEDLAVVNGVYKHTGASINQFQSPNSAWLG